MNLNTTVDTTTKNSSVLTENLEYLVNKKETMIQSFVKRNYRTDFKPPQECIKSRHNPKEAKDLSHLNSSHTTTMLMTYSVNDTILNDVDLNKKSPRKCDNID